MKIEIDYNGSLAACKVDGKPFSECDVNEQVFAMDAFRTIIKDWERQNKQQLNKVSWRAVSPIFIQPTASNPAD